MRVSYLFEKISGIPYTEIHFDRPKYQVQGLITPSRY